MKERKFSIFVKKTSGEVEIIKDKTSRAEAFKVLSEMTGYDISTLNRNLHKLEDVTVNTHWNIKEITITERAF